MSEFKNMEQTLTKLQNYYEHLKQVLKEAENNPEILLTDDFLNYPLDRQYILMGLTACFGEDALVSFIEEYFNKILKVFSLKIPIDEIELSPTIYHDKYVLVGFIDEEPKIIIDTFSKTIEYVLDESLVDLMDERDASIALINELEMKLEDLASQSKQLITKRQKQNHQQMLNTLVTQIGLEKQQLSIINDSLIDVENANAFIHETLDRFTSRLINLFGFKLIPQPD